MNAAIKKDEISNLLNLLADFEIFGPAVEKDALLFSRLDGNNLLFDFTNTQKPPKDVFFPQTEKMLDFEREGKQFIGVKEPEKSVKSILLFGVRPCDARSTTILDSLFSWDYIDTYYVDRRERATIISFSCTPPQLPEKNCFCTSVGGSPSSKEGVDMLWTDIGDSYYVESFRLRSRRC